MDKIVKSGTSRVVANGDVYVYIRYYLHVDHVFERYTVLESERERCDMNRGKANSEKERNN